MGYLHRNALLVLLASALWAILHLYVHSPTEPPEGGFSEDVHSQEVLKAAGQALNCLALKLYNQFTAQEPSSNILFSPLSIASGFAYIYIGSGGRTKAELEEGLCFKAEGVAMALLSLEKFMQQKNSRGVEILLANKLYIQTGFELKYSEFEQVLRRNAITALNFSGDPIGSKKIINKHISEATRGFIRDAAPEVDPVSTKMVLANAIFFKGKWKNEFDRARTRHREFRGFDLKFEVEMMGHWTSKWTFGYLPHITVTPQILELPYGNGNTSMFIILPVDPGKETFKMMEQVIQDWDLVKLLDSLYTAEAEVWIPKFEISESVDLTDSLPKLGVRNVFDGKRADLSGFADEPLHVSDARHEAKLKVDETGVLAAAATQVTISRLSAPKMFIVDHPFIFLIVDKSIPTILFMGNVKEFPTSAVKGNGTV